MQFPVDWMLVAILSATAGTVDVIGFLALGGLFTAHIGGNLVVLVAHYVTGGFSQMGPLLSVPVFVAVLGIITALYSDKLTRRTRRGLLILHASPPYQLLGTCWDDAPNIPIVLPRAIFFTDKSIICGVRVESG